MIALGVQNGMLGTALLLHLQTLPKEADSLLSVIATLRNESLADVDIPPSNIGASKNEGPSIDPNMIGFLL